MDACAHGVTTTFLSSFTAEVAAMCRIGGERSMMKMIRAEKRRSREWLADLSLVRSVCHVRTVWELQR